ncbi:response regulator transcription factor [Aeoliella mucimassa]|uniref:Transcriptional regulatory protein TdiR n=1 Tax=Aeoliella mucimassa TaxID=2527972 RepID=A0A518AL75_9BACT|nr:response regulator [Aeoliella mucimassa]QDU55479.1 Transcriptional regulatory protein TdiR [Aeoliella mucimassa]
MADTPTVYIVDDDNDSRDSVETLLAEMKVPFRAYASAEEFLETYDGARPGCLVTDVRMLQMSGLELQEELQRRGITISVVVVTAYADTPIVVRAIKNGAVTLLEKPCREHELWDAIREGLARDEENYRRETRRAELRARIDQLTPAEKEVLDLIVAGEPNKRIATSLDISVRTVEVRRQHVFTKLQADSVAELVKIVVEAEQ